MSPIDDNVRLDFTRRFDAWFLDLKDAQAVSRIAARLERLSEGHWGDTKPVGARVVELRIHHGAGYRLYATQIGRCVVVMLAGGDKSTQKRDIAAAQAMAKEYHDAT